MVFPHSHHSGVGVGENANLVSDHRKIPMSTSPLKLQNVLKQQSQINQQLFQAASNGTNIPSVILSTLDRNTQQIEAICIKHQVTPAALAIPSRAAYTWMKFLTHKNNLQLHFDTLCRSINISTEIIKTQKQGTGQIFIEFIHGASLYKFRAIQNLTTLSISESFIHSSNEVLTAVLQNALIKKTTAANQIIRKFEISEECSDILLELDLIAQIAAETAQGNIYNLDTLFSTINQQYFAGKMSKPRLMWSSILSHRKLGHYERTRDRVVISKTLDHHRIPQYLVEFVLYHELLHKHHGIQWVNGKYLAHTPEFKRSERKFSQFQEAETFLKQDSLQ
jgi:hypothetical protein